MNASGIGALCQKVILHSRNCDKCKIFRVHAVKFYRSAVTATLICKLDAR